MLFTDLRLEKEILFNLIEHHPAYIVVYNSERQIVYLNKTALSAKDSKLKDFVGREEEDLLPQEIRKQYLPTVKYVQENEQVTTIEITIGTDDQVSSYKVDFIPVKAADGNPCYIFAFINNISEQKKKELQINAACQRCYHLIEHVPVGLGIVQTKIDGTILYANNEYLNIYEYESLAELKKHKAHELYRNKEDRTKLLVKLKEQQGFLRDYELNIKTKTGKIKTLVFSAFRYNNEINKVIIDITERKELELALKEKEKQASDLVKELALEHKKLSAIIDNLPIGVGISDLTGKTISLNKAGLEAFGFKSFEELYPNPEQYNKEFELRYPDGRVMPLAEWPASRALKGELVKNYELLLRRRSIGPERSLSFTVAPLRDDKGNINLYLYMVEDLTERKKTENALRVSEATMETFFDASPGILLIIDKQARVIKSDRITPTYFGLNRQSIAGKSLKELNPLAAELTLGPIMKRVLETGEPFVNQEVSAKVPSRGEELVSWLVSCFPVPLPEGEKGLGTIGLEITERKKSENALRESEERFRTLADNISQMAWMEDATANVFWYNKRWYEYTGTTWEEVRGLGWQKLHHPDYLQKVVEKFNGHLKTGEPWEDTFPLRSRTGEYRWFLSRAIPIKDAQGKVLRWFGTNTDITERIKMEEDLKRSEKKYRAIFEGSNDPITVVDVKQRKYLDVNERFCNFTGFSKEEILAMKSGTTITPPHLHAKLKEITQRLLAEKALIYDWEIQKKTGEIIPVQASSRIVEIEGTGYVFSMLRDMRSIKEAEEILKRDRDTLEKLVRERTKALLKARRLSEIGTLASTIAHELRNPLTAIQLGAYNIRRKTTEKEKIDKQLKTIEKKVAESNQIIDDLLHFVRVKPPELKLVDLCELILESESIAKGKYQKKGIRVQDNTPHIKNLYIKCDPVQLQEVLSNILNNAFEALGEEGFINITISPETNLVKVITEDNGPGIPQEIIEKLFEPFVSTKPKGTGLGLAISKQIVENHNGTINLDSKKGAGTTVTITLPK